MEILMMKMMMIRWKFKNWDRASPIGPDILEVYAWSCFLDGVASPESIKARSRLSLDQLLNSTSHMLCIWGTVNRRNLQYLRVGSAVFCTGRPNSLRARSVGKPKVAGSPPCAIRCGQALEYGCNGEDFGCELVKGCHVGLLECPYVVWLGLSLQG